MFIVVVVPLAPNVWPKLTHAMMHSREKKQLFVCVVVVVTSGAAAAANADP